MGCAVSCAKTEPIRRSLSGSRTRAPTFHDRYRLGRELGKGSYAIVYEAHAVERRRGGSPKPSDMPRPGYAVKVVNKLGLPNEEREALLEEVAILQYVQHPNIVQLHDFFESSDSYYLVMEKLEGGELFDRIVLKTRYSEKEARDVVGALLSALRHLHDGNVVHRDIKPENLLLTSAHDDADIKIADFGFAKKDVLAETLRSRCGTPGFVAPEILKGHTYGQSVDVWSLGCIVYILLGGYPPFDDASQPMLFRKIKSGSYAFHEEYWGHVSEDAKDLIRRMLTLNPDERITAHEALRHQWIMSTDEELAKRNIDASAKELRKHNARRKLRAAIRAIVAANRMKSIVAQLAAGQA